MLTFLRQCLAFAFCFFLNTMVMAQSGGFIQLKGLVLEEKTEQVVPFATVRIKGAAIGTITDLRGSFSFWISEKYGKGNIEFSSVGYLPKQMAVADLKWGAVNRIILEPDTVNLGQVTVVRDKKLKPLEVLKRAIARVPANYRSKTTQFDAYYRERVLENGAIIKYADAAVTFEQTGYDGRKYKQQLGWGPEWKSSERYGTWLAGYGGLGRARDRLHDHFGHKTAKGDRVKIHEARLSQNNSREGLQANIEGGPLGTLSKDLVKYLAHFMDQKNFKEYLFELLEIPNEKGDWDYLVKFKPEKAPRPLEEILAAEGRTSRMDILTGEIYIDKTSFAIKKMNYRVGQRHRRHICNLQLMSVKHYGYQVDVDYHQHQGKWQLQQLRRVDEFIFKDTISHKSTPYSAISEIFITNNKVSEPMGGEDNYENQNHNSLQYFETEYHPEYWQKYEQTVAEARLNTALSKEELNGLNLHDQFRKMKIRKPMSAPKAITVSEITGSNQELKGTDRDYLESENAYTDNYFGPLEKIQQDLLIEFSIGERYQNEVDSSETRPYELWADFKGSVKGWVYQVWERKIDNPEYGKADITMFFTGKDKDRWLKERPVLIRFSTEKPGLKMKFDPAIAPLLNRGMILAYVHVKDKKQAFGRKAALAATDKLLATIKYLRDNSLAHPEMIFLQGNGPEGWAMINAIHQSPELFNGAVLSFDDPLEAGEQRGLGDQNEAASYPNMALFINLDNGSAPEVINLMSGLRSLMTDQNLLLLNTRLKSEAQDKLSLDTYQYALLFQWIDDADSPDKK